MWPNPFSFQVGRKSRGSRLWTRPPDRGSFEMKEVLPIDDPVTVDTPGVGCSAVSRVATGTSGVGLVGSYTRR